MENKVDNGAKLAFPCDGMYAGEVRNNSDAGFSKREMIAAMALQGILANSQRNYNAYYDMAEDAIRATDALLDQLEKKG